MLFVQHSCGFSHVERPFIEASTARCDVFTGKAFMAKTGFTNAFVLYNLLVFQNRLHVMTVCGHFVNVGSSTLVHDF